MKGFLLRWLVTTIAVVASTILPGISYDSLPALLGASLVLGILNACVRPVLLILSIPFILVTMGIFILILNGLLLWLVSALIPSFHVAGFWSAVFGALIISLVSWILNSFFRSPEGRLVYIQTGSGTHSRSISEPQIKTANARVIKPNDP
jgi:putative membrane protein